nr:hypothetical protein [Polymorphobacter sp.]
MTNLLTEIERCLRRRNISASRFGREAASDPRFVFDLRRGREPRPRTAARVMTFIASAPPPESRS